MTTINQIHTLATIQKKTKGPADEKSPPQTDARSHTPSTQQVPGQVIARVKRVAVHFKVQSHTQMQCPVSCPFCLSHTRIVCRGGAIDALSLQVAEFP